MLDSSRKLVFDMIFFLSTLHTMFVDRGPLKRRLNHPQRRHFSFQVSKQFICVFRRFGAPRSQPLKRAVLDFPIFAEEPRKEEDLTTSSSRDFNKKISILGKMDLIRWNETKAQTKIF